MPFPKPPLTYNLASDYDTFLNDWYSENPMRSNDGKNTPLSFEDTLNVLQTSGMYAAFKVNFARGYTPTGSLVQQLYVSPVQSADYGTSQAAADADAQRLKQAAADALAAQQAATAAREQAAKDAIVAENDATGTQAQQKDAQTFAAGKMQSFAPAPMGCDWIGIYSRATGVSHLSVNLTSVFGNAFTALEVSGNDISDVKNVFLQTVNSLKPTTLNTFYTSIVRNITGNGISCNTKADADAAIMSALVDLNRFPKIPYDAVCASRADTLVLVAERQKKGTSSAIITDAQNKYVGNYPENTNTAPGEKVGVLTTTSQKQSDYGYEDSLAQQIFPSIADNEGVAAPGFGEAFPAPATGDNFEYTGKGGGVIKSPSTLGTSSFNVSSYVNLGLVPADFGDYTDWNQLQVEYDARQKNSQSAPIPTAVAAWIAQQQKYASQGITPVDIGFDNWSDAKSDFLKKYNAGNVPKVVDVSATQDTAQWWTIGGVIVLIIAAAYFGKQA